MNSAFNEERKYNHKINQFIQIMYNVSYPTLKICCLQVIYPNITLNLSQIGSDVGMHIPTTKLSQINISSIILPPVNISAINTSALNLYNISVPVINSAGAKIYDINLPVINASAVNVSEIGLSLV